MKKKEPLNLVLRVFMITLSIKFQKNKMLSKNSKKNWKLQKAQIKKKVVVAVKFFNLESFILPISSLLKCNAVN